MSHRQAKAPERLCLIRSTYIVRLKRPIIIGDHWQVPFMKGTCVVVKADGKSTALEIAFTGEPVTNALWSKSSTAPSSFQSRAATTAKSS